MEIKITLAVPDFDPNPNKTTTNNHKWRQCVLVEFPNCISTRTNKSFKWIPTYQQLEDKDIKKELMRCEEVNKQLARENLNS